MLTIACILTWININPHVHQNSFNFATFWFWGTFRQKHNSSSHCQSYRVYLPEEVPSGLKNAKLNEVWCTWRLNKQIFNCLHNCSILGLRDQLFTTQTMYLFQIWKFCVICVVVMNMCSICKNNHVNMHRRNKTIILSVL